MAELNNSSSGQWSETDASNISPSPDGWPNGTFFNQVEPIGRSTMGAIKRFWDRINGTVTSTGSADAYVYTPANINYPTAIVAGEEFSFKANFANTGAATLNINGLGATSLYRQSLSGPAALTGGEIQSGQIVKVQYDGARYQILSATASGVDSIQNGAVTASSFAKTSDTTLAAVTGLIAPVLNGGTYIFEVYLDTTSNVGGGIKFLTAASGGAAASSYRATTIVWNGSTPTQSTLAASSLGSAVEYAVTAVTVAKAFMKGSFVCSASGNFIVSFAQNVSNGAASSVLANSYLKVTRVA